MAAPLAKLSPPRLARVVRRERLLRLFDGGLRAPVVWVGSGAGSGKTTAVAAHLAERKSPLRWYRVDSGDLDLASFFFYLAALAPTGRKRKALPIFGPEFADQPVAFARRFFRDFYSRLPAESTLVFDDVHAAAGTLLPAILGIAIEELPPGSRLFLVSREDPPATFAGFRATDRLSIVDDAILRFEDDEAAALVQARVGEAADAQVQARVRSRARGWAAGLVLLSEQALRAQGGDHSLASAPGQPLFDYFAREVFGCMDDDEQRFMELTSLLPELTPGAAALVAQRDDAQAVLDDLYRRQLFITRAADVSLRYAYHDLFRAFLTERLRMRLSRDALRDAYLRAAEAALADCASEHAIALFLDAQAWDRAGAVLEAHARTLLQQGRRATLRALVERIPADVADNAPMLDYWLGVASMIDDDQRALRHFDRAYLRFAQQEQGAARCLTAAQAVLAIHMSWSTQAGGLEWVKRLDGSVASAHELAAADRLLVSTALLRGATMDETYRTDEAAIAAEAEYALAELEARSGAIDANARLVAADALQEHALHTNDPSLFERTVAASTPYISDGAVTSWTKCHWLISFGLVSGRKYPYHRAGFPYADAWAALQHAWETSRRDELPNLSFAATFNMLNVARGIGDFQLASAMLARLQSECDPANPIQVFHFLTQKAGDCAARGRYAEGLAAIEDALAATDRARLPDSELWSTWMGRAQMLICVDREGEAAAFARERARRFSGVFEQALEIVAESAEILKARRERSPDYEDRLRACMAEVRAMEWANYMTMIPRVVSQLWSDALARGIERDFIVAAIRRRNLPPPDSYAPWWPWRVRVHVLGRLEIECDDVPVVFGAKAQLKPLELLKVLVAAPQQRIDVQHLHAWLWPDATSEAAKAALEIAVHRLRKLLRVDDALRMSAGKLALSPDHVWVDAAAFEAWLPQAQRELDAQPQIAAADLLGERLFNDYRGRLFGDDESQPWFIGPRERLHQGYLGLVASLGRFHEVRGDWTRAAAVYERGLAQDQLAEQFHRGLIRCHLARNEPAAAMHAFRRCREILSIVLGVAPAAATRDLVAHIAA